MTLARLLVLASLVAAAACTTTPPSTTPCERDADCGEGRACALVDDAPTCVTTCDLANPCDADHACTLVEGEPVCVPIEGTATLGAVCEGDRDCASGACALEPGGPVCVMDCTSGERCLDGTRCLESGPRLLCLSPLDDRADGEACTSPRDCLSSFCVRVPHLDDAVCASSCGDGCAAGLVCAEIAGGGAVCVVGADDGAPCTTSALCLGGVCITDLDGTSFCTSPCVDGDCAEPGLSCVPTDDDVHVCMPPLDDKPALAPCASARECASGHCGRFATDDEDLGDLCADPCGDGGICADGLVCWSTSVGPDLCGPTPP